MTKPVWGIKLFNRDNVKCWLYFIKLWRNYGVLYDSHQHIGAEFLGQNCWGIWIIISNHFVFVCISNKSSSNRILSCMVIKASSKQNQCDFENNLWDIVVMTMMMLLLLLQCWTAFSYERSAFILFFTDYFVYVFQIFGYWPILKFESWDNLSKWQQSTPFYVIKVCRKKIKANKAQSISAMFAVNILFVWSLSNKHYKIYYIYGNLPRYTLLCVYHPMYYIFCVVRISNH